MKMSQISILILTGICDKERVKFLHCSPWWGLDLGRDPPRDLIFFKFKTIKNVPEQTKMSMTQLLDLLIMSHATLTVKGATMIVLTLMMRKVVQGGRGGVGEEEEEATSTAALRKSPSLNFCHNLLSH